MESKAPAPIGGSNETQSMSTRPFCLDELSCRRFLVASINTLRQNKGTWQKKPTISCFFALLIAYTPSPFGAEEKYAAHDVKAAFILNFPNFITWPNRKDASPITICTFNADAVSDSIEMLLASEKMVQRKGRIVFLRNADSGVLCDLAFIGIKAQNRISDVGLPDSASRTLVVSDIPNYAIDGGMIELAMADSKITVIVNRQVMESGGFISDSRLLQLTTDVSALRMHANK